MRSIKELRELTGLSQTAFSKKYNIPKRTIENWETGTRKPPAYVLELLESVINEDLALVLDEQGEIVKKRMYEDEDA